ncbi:Panacea domain-containing protein [Methylocystis iwaonis]|uniref:Antitoxin SocA-like Panacea domain-containing protein n=1 Tax=Methylocystis iwaonis TaxID=2885079 RepID=A0ABN6VJ81_9HYPH|nr:type II toxin-antitoxin system antitoxin SocA domain-containing protein [Methylocystis iwaonis]BDV35395.1 hypothetical protein SS37A_29240 [Methylocystis iwaonis]
MAGWSPEIANEFIRLAQAAGHSFTQMQLQKLVYIAHGWALAITGAPLTVDAPEAWEYGPVYRSLRSALRTYGASPITHEITNSQYFPAAFTDAPGAPARATLSGNERQIINRVFADYGRFHAFQLSALTHQPGTPWSDVYRNGLGKFEQIPNDLIRQHFVDLAIRRQPAAANH